MEVRHGCNLSNYCCVHEYDNCSWVELDIVVNKWHVKQKKLSDYLFVANGEILHPPEMSYFCPVVQTIGERGKVVLFENC